MSAEEASVEEGSVVLSYEGPVAVIRLGAPQERIAVLTKERMESLGKAFAEVGSKSGLTGLLIAGASAHGFCAGADLDAIREVRDPQVGAALAKQGQELFSQLEKLPLRKVALIRGACVGGGCELVLACDFRLMSSGEDAKIGLPEVKLGILPGFGGTQRLPRLVGITRALDLILKGKVVGAKEALKAGLVDELLEEDAAKPAEERFRAQLERALELASKRRSILRKPLPFVEKLLTFTALGRRVVRSKVDKSVQRETKGQYPAPPKAVESVFHGLASGLDAGYRFEATALGELVATPVCKALVHVFRISEAAGKLGRSATSEVSNRSVAVVGAGVMGAGIAGAFLVRGHRVLLVDSFPGALEKGRAHIGSFIRERRNLSSEKKEERLKALQASPNVPDGAALDLIIEAVVEDTEVKRKLLQDIIKRVPKEAMIATNTSSLSVTTLAKSVASPERFLGMHFFNPAEKMPLLEIVRTESTGSAALMRAAAFATQIGKYPIIVEDVPGFLVNRILTPYLTEAGVLLAQGVGIREIDRAATDFGMPMGPLRLIDEVGLDIAAKVSEMLSEAYGERMKSSGLVEKLLKSGRKGKKGGAGFYLYEGETANPDPDVRRLLELPTLPDETVLREDLVDRLILPMVNEAVLCLDEEVAGHAGAEAAGQIDLGSVMGTGFAPFRGGVLHYADQLGAARLESRLRELERRYGKRFSPAPGVTERSRNNRTFREALR